MKVRDENEYEDLLGQWSDLESGLGIILSNPANTQQFAHRVVQYDRWMQGLLQRDPDVGLYLLFQLASNSPVGYSASHALVCGVLCHLVATEQNLPVKERNSLVHAALTMNIAMTALQDELASQVEKPSPQQQDAIRAHTIKGAMMLANLGVSDDDWLDIVSSHHDESLEKEDLRTAAVSAKLARILMVVDRYAAMISPRKSRSGRSAIESARSIMTRATSSVDEIGHALVRAVGLCPPGTYVRLDNEELAVVVRRSHKNNQPFVVVVGKPSGELEPSPRLHSTAEAYPRIRSALPSAAVRSPLNHFHILQLGSHALA
ncbi:HD domain-containing phosphohydrolase [Rhodoferax saidenbachensis]|uniref:HD-GYP domain-containing protein (C-di-GMP phosphodiesterase class II) n=1 Tax=Rhodoferax saidenbachensis TaxID=1484693 RepID=A0ABU1ZQS1_9BURK|nr:HD domain-containing phosphohydrolase [Rhodoferax saidenbachensis]MDR7307899.1 HD-GYP domain-containing protein (c-di-GMP phosphodiesterase class II) [Rhodoferax saidenbachensis]